MAETVTGTVCACPECGGRMVKASFVVINRSGDKKQQWRCVVCGRRTLNPKEVKRANSSTNTTENVTDQA